MELMTITSIAINICIAGLVLYYKSLIHEFISLRKHKNLYEFQKELDRNAEKRYKAEKVAELFSRFFNSKGGADDIYEFEKLYWELCFYLAKDLICGISEKLVHDSSKRDAMDLFIQIREYLGIKDGLVADNIIFIPEIHNAN